MIIIYKSVLSGKGVPFEEAKERLFKSSIKHQKHISVCVAVAANPRKRPVYKNFNIFLCHHQLSEKKVLKRVTYPLPSLQLSLSVTAVNHVFLMTAFTCTAPFQRLSSPFLSSASLKREPALHYFLRYSRVLRLTSTKEDLTRPFSVERGAPKSESY